MAYPIRGGSINQGGMSRTDIARQVVRVILLQFFSLDQQQTSLTETVSAINPLLQRRIKTILVD
ncbi:hypothetical protein PtB15_5B705 [Puccinia triticina]|nr:hypothetical protein PtB15_5B705 [Puccinia triticina]